MGAPVRALRLAIHPTRDGAVVVLLGRDFAGGGARDREFRRVHLDLGDRLSMDDPGAACLALSDALAEIADTFR